MVGLFGGLILPPDDDPAALRASGNWRIIFCINLPMYFLIVTLLLTVVNRDTPKFLLARGKSVECTRVVHKIYKTNGDEQIAEEISQFIASTI